MTPKERAESLLDIMSKQTYKYQSYAGATYIEDEVGYEAGKKCALIAVDLILNELGAKDWEKDTATKTNYWQDVETELTLK
jgi:hypothetical protein